MLFALAHGIGQSVPIFFDRFAFGLVAGYLVVRTGGLEAGIAMHVVNNSLAFGLALAFGDMAARSTPPAEAGGRSRATLTESLVYLLLAVRLADRLGVARRGRASVLEASRARVYRVLARRRSALSRRSRPSRLPWGMV